MLHSIAAGTSRQAVVLTAIFALHFGLYLAFSAIKVEPPAKDDSEGPIIDVELPKPVEQARPPAPDEYVPGEIFYPEPPTPFENAKPDEVVAPDGDTTAGPGDGPSIAVKPDVWTKPEIALDPRKISALINTCYPSASRRMGEEGTVYVAVVIGAGGKPVSWRVTKSSGFPRLDAAVPCVIGKLPFKAATHNRMAVQSEVTLPISFRLN